MNELNNDVGDDEIDNEFIDPELIFYSTNTRGGEQLIYLNKVYQIKRNSITLNGNYRIDWQCKDRKICRGIHMIRSYRINPNIQQDFNVTWLDVDHQLNCHTDASTIVVEQCKKDLIDRIGSIGNMNEIVSRQLVHETVLREYGNIELHPEVPPGLVLPTFYNMHTIYSRVARINRPVVPEINEIERFLIPDRYALITVDNVQQRFVLHRQTAMNEETDELNAFMVLGTDLFFNSLLNSTFVSGDGTFRIAPYPFKQLYTFNFFQYRVNTRKMFCGIYVLMTHKSTFLYKLVIEWMVHYALQNDIHILWQNMMSDFEMAVKNALEEIFHKRLVWNGCYFHFSQAIQRKIQTIGLSTEYRDKNTLFSI